MFGQHEAIPDWFEQGNCRNVGLELAVVFLYSKHGKTARTDLHTPQGVAKKICEGCPVLMPCRIYGEKLPGIYGQMTINERRDYFRELRQKRSA